MQQAAYGIFREGQVILNEAVTVPDETDVVVVFLDAAKAASRELRGGLLDVFSVLGPWEDSRGPEAVIEEIERSRVSRKADTVL
ncbi:MAG: hypothetical protein LBR85_08780 [Oscillospiraceae bacterium]|jgi:hypothetical protein|nr:hypothetical protein [Oscillospiraceae bacterium]